MDGILPLDLDYKAPVIGLCQTDNQLGGTADDKVESAIWGKLKKIKALR